MKRRDDFNAGYSAAIIVFLVIGVLQSHGHADSSHVTWGDIAFFLLLMGIFAACVIDVHGYWKRRKSIPEWSIVVKFPNQKTYDDYLKETGLDKKFAQQKKAKKS